MPTPRWTFSVALTLLSACTLAQSYTALTNGECGGSPCAVANGTPACSAAGACVVSACNAGFADCNGDPADGCEAELGASPSSCGACGVACSYANAQGVCSAGTCALGACSEGFADCNGDAADGCEVDLRTSTAHCGACGNACGLCAAGKCVAASALVSSAHSDFTCALLEDGSLRCWGDGSANQLGSGTACAAPPCYRHEPVVVAIPRVVSAVATGAEHACAVSEGKVLCWGSNSDGQLGLGSPLPDNSPYPTPREVPGLLDVEALSAGARFTVVQTRARGLTGFGANRRGQLALGNRLSQSQPQSIGGVVSAAAVAAGSEHTCYRNATGQLHCSGNNEQFALGVEASRANQQCDLLASNTKCSYAFLDVPGQTTTVSIAAGANHTCVTRQPSSVACTGSNELGQLGTGGATGVGSVAQSFTGSFVPAGFGDTIQLVAGARHTCALQRDGALWCWGANGEGELGTPGVGALSAVPVRVLDAAGQPLRDVVSVAAGRSHTCVLLASKKVLCFGRNDKAQLGARPESLSSSAVPIEVKVP